MLNKDLISKKVAGLFLLRGLLGLTLVFLAGAAHAESIGVLQFLAPWMKADTLLDNTAAGTEKIMAPGWVSSGQSFPKSFGLTFKTGPSEYVLQYVTVLVMAGEMIPAFDGELKVSLHEVPSDDFPPSDVPIYEATAHVNFPIKESYRRVGLNLQRLKANTWYALTISAPNEVLARIMGYQVPNVAPTPAMGFVAGPPFWGQSGEWIKLMNPYIWVQGWDVKSEAYAHLERTAFFLTFGLLAIFVGVLALVLRYGLKRGSAS